MTIEAIQTRILVPPKDDLLQVLGDVLKRIPNRSILAVSSKVVSIWEGRCISRQSVSSKDELIAKEADAFLPRDFAPGRWVMHTLKQNLLIPSAGIDESNAADYFVLWPKAPRRSARVIQNWLVERFGVKEVGIVIVDSHSIPLRRGTVGISLGHAGFAPLKDYRGEQDLFGRPLKITQQNVVDGIAAACTLVMGEGDEATPVALVTDPPVSFQEIRSRRPYSSLSVTLTEDLYAPFLTAVPWQQGR